MRALTLCCLLAALAPAADPAPTPEIRWPKVVTPAPAPPPPAPAPGEVNRIDRGRWFVIDSDVELVVLDGRPGRLTITADQGPLRVRGLFVDGGDEPDVKVYNGKFVYCIEVKKGAEDGEVELLVARAPAKSAADFERRVLQVGGGKPADPDKPKPVPDPVEPKDPLFAPLKAAWEKKKDPDALAKLVKVWKAAAATDLTPFQTAGQLRTALKQKAVDNKLAEDDLRPVREAIEAELEQFLPKKADAALTQDHKANAKSTFTRILTSLEALK